jgi:transposase
VCIEFFCFLAGVVVCFVCDGREIVAELYQFNGILWRLSCGTPSRGVPSKYGNWSTIYRRFRRWSEAGVWEAVSVTLTGIMADSGHDRSIAPWFAPMFRQRAEKKAYRRALGRSRGGFTSKLHCLADARGRPLAFLTVGEAADRKAYDTLIALLERAPTALLADKGYDADAISADLASLRAVTSGPSSRVDQIVG